MFEDDDDEELFEGVYVYGHWEWDDTDNILKFVREKDYQSTTETILMPPTFTGPVDFKNDLDIIEQQRFRKRMQRKNEGPEDVVTLQDVKDIVMYTAPLSILNRSVVNFMHTPSTDRLLRALILYTQYYVQVAEEMSRRSMDLENKIPTEKTQDIENGFRENLQDIRLLVAKEYSAMIFGAAVQRTLLKGKPHNKNRHEAFVFEAFVTLSTQIVFVALGRKGYHYIGPEISRLFRSDKFNMSEHHAKNNTESTRNNAESKLSPEERKVLYGNCADADKTLLRQTPLINELHCLQHADYRLFGLGVIQYPRLDTRLKYFERILTEDEREFPALRMNLGIIGLKRSLFDTMLKEIPEAQPTSRLSTASSGKFTSSRSRLSTASSAKITPSRSVRSCASSRKSTTAAFVRTIPDIRVPTAKSKEIDFPIDFPETTSKRATTNDLQHMKWLRRVTLLRSKLLKKMSNQRPK